MHKMCIENLIFNQFFILMQLSTYSGTYLAFLGVFLLPLCIFLFKNQFILKYVNVSTFTRTYAICRYQYEKKNAFFIQKAFRMNFKIKLAKVYANVCRCNNVINIMNDTLQ